MAFSAPSLTKVCVAKIVKDIKKFCYGTRFEELGRFKYIIGPFDNVSSQCIEAIFEYVISTKQLSVSWLSVLIVPHLRGVDFKLMPSGVTTQLFKMLINRCEHLERLIIPNCKKISNNTLVNLLQKNSSLLELDISNKLSPKVDLSVVETLARSCRCLTILKLSDYRANDPQTLLVLCSKKVVGRQQQIKSMRNHPPPLPVHNALEVYQCESKLLTKEEHKNSIISGTLTLDSELNEGNSDEDLYESDGTFTALAVEDCDDGYGCLELEVLSLDNVNINDQVMAILLQNLPRLRDLHLCDTDICNPWRLLDPSCCPHLLLLEELDIKSTALSRTALELIPRFHPDLHRFSISSTMMPPHTYANIGKLTGVADLELIGGQFYPSKPEEIFDKGIAPAIRGIGQHLRLLNLAYFAHIEFEVIPKSCPKLERLDMSCAFVTFRYPCDSLGDCCHNLRSLNLASCRIEAHENAIDDTQSVSPSEALQCMIGQPLKLTELNISGLAVSDETLKSIFPYTVHPLQILNLSRCALVTVNAIEYVWGKCPYLHTIDLTYCRDITVDDFTLLEKKFYIDRPLFKSEGKLNWK